MCQVTIWMCDRATQFQSKTNISSVLTIESPVPQWSESPARSRKFVGSNPIWDSNFYCHYYNFTIAFNTHLEEAAVALPWHLHWWMVLVDGLILVDDQHWWMVMVDGPVLLVVVLPRVCYKLAEPPQKDHTKFEEKLQYYMFSERTNVILQEDLHQYVCVY